MQTCLGVWEYGSLEVCNPLTPLYTLAHEQEGEECYMQEIKRAGGHIGVAELVAWLVMHDKKHTGACVQVWTSGFSVSMGVSRASRAKRRAARG